MRICPVLPLIHRSGSELKMSLAAKDYAKGMSAHWRRRALRHGAPSAVGEEHVVLPCSSVAALASSSVVGLVARSLAALVARSLAALVGRSAA